MYQKKHFGAELSFSVSVTGGLTECVGNGYETHLDKGVLISDVVHYNGSLAITVVDGT